MNSEVNHKIIFVISDLLVSLFYYLITKKIMDMKIVHLEIDFPIIISMM
jgi:hypothetical protein